MKTTGIEGLTLHDDGGFSLGGTPVPAGAEFPAVQLEDWTLSKALGEGKPLIASRGDGRRLVFEFKNGRWNEGETDTARRPIQNRQRGREQDDVAEQLERLATTPLDMFHWWPVTEAVPVNAPQYSSDNKDEHNEGDIVLYSDGTAVLGSECFPVDVGIKAYRFGGSVAYRERGCSMLVIASPGGVRFYYAKCGREVEGPYDTLGLPGFRVGRHEWAECQGPFRGLKRLLLRLDGVEVREGRFKTSTFSSQRLYGPTCPSLVYLSSDRTVYVRLWGQEIEDVGAARPELRLEYLTEPKRQNQAYWYPGYEKVFGTQKSMYESSYDIEEPYVAIPSGVSFTYKSPNLAIDTWSDRVLVEYSFNYMKSYFDVIRNAPSTVRDHVGHLITRGEATYSYATWRTPDSPGSWDWYKLTPRQGVMKLPQLGGQPLKRLGR